MPTDDERRRVAKELRDFFPINLVSELTDVDCHLASMVMGEKFCPSNCLECFETVCERLADLIETDTTTDTTKSAQDTTKCDRDALLALADEMEAWALTCDHYDRRMLPIEVARYARRIREACGEEVA